MIGNGNVLWAQTPLLVSIWVNAQGAYVATPMYIAGFEDWRLDQGFDADFSDFVIGVQIFPDVGIPFGPAPVPEASAYGLATGVLLLGSVALRRRRSEKRAANI